MGFLDELKRLTNPYEDEMEDDYDEEEDLYEDEDEDDDVPPPPPPVREEAPRRREYQQPPRQQSPGDKVVNIHATTQIQVVLVKPKRYDNAAEIANHLRDKRTVVLNLEDTDENVARRLLDFLSGVAYAQEGEIKKVAKQTFLVTPFNVRFEGDLLDELENGKIFFSVRTCLKNVYMPTAGSFLTIFHQNFLKSTKDSCKIFALSGEKIPRHWTYCLFFKQALKNKKEETNGRVPRPDQIEKDWDRSDRVC